MRQLTNPGAYAAAKTSLAAAVVLILVTAACGAALAQDSAPTRQPSAHHKFAAGPAGRAIPTHGALRAGYDESTSEDGTVVDRYQEWYQSAAQARERLEKLTKHASRVIKRGTKKDTKGNVVGQRVELAFEGVDKANSKFVIAWTDGATLVRLRSASLPLLLDFESQFYP